MPVELPDFFHTDVCDMFDIEYPIIQAGMGGTRRSMADLTAAVADAGGLGQILHPTSTKELEEKAEEFFIKFSEEDLVLSVSRLYADFLLAFLIPDTNLIIKKQPNIFSQTFFERSEEKGFT